jgi:hypothetical protein
MSANRRTFIKNLGAIGGTSLLATTPLLGEIAESETTRSGWRPKGNFPRFPFFKPRMFIVRFIPTMSYSGKIIRWFFRKTGGYAQLATWLKKGAEKANALVFD